jgi:hypothetical protein
MPANRVLTIAHIAIVWCAAVAAFIAGITKTLPLGWQDAALSVAGILGGVAGTLPVVLRFLSGSQAWDQTPAGQAAALPVDYANRVTGKRPVTGEEPITNKVA